MTVGLVASYGLFALEGLLFLLPRQVGPKMRDLFAGRLSQFSVGGVRRILDLDGGEILIRRASETDFQAFSSTCPHLGCKVRWEEEEQKYFCPCHRGEFNPEGVATAGPPADAEQSLIPVPLKVDLDAGVLYISVKQSIKKT